MLSMELLMSLFIFMYLSGMWVYCSKRKHLLIVLLSLEYMVLMIYFLLGLKLMFMNYGMYLLMLFLVIVVCEGALSLGIVVSMIRSYGNDFFQSFSVLRC